MWNWNGRRPSSFIEVYLPNFSAEKLKIPPRFIKFMEGKTSGLVLLMGPSGNIWHVKLVKHSDDLFLHDGWTTFVKDHSIQCGDSLVFGYEGNLCFTVQIFDQSSCEKEQAFCATCSQEASDCNRLERKRGREEGKTYADPSADSPPKKMRNIFFPVTLNYPEEKRDMKMIMHTVEGCHPEEKYGGGQDIQASAPSLEKRPTDASEKLIVLGLPAADMMGKYIGHSKSIKKEKAIKNKFRVSACIEESVTQHFTSSFPYFVKVMNWSSVGKGNLKIPVKFSRKYLPKFRTKITLHNQEGDCWPVISIPLTKFSTRHTLSRGWTAFIRDNDIKMEDICIFELVGDCEMSVHIVRLGVEGFDNQRDQGAAGHKVDRLQPQSSYENVTVEDFYDDPGPRGEVTIMTEAPQEALFSIDTKVITSTSVNPTLSLESEFADIKKDEHVTSSTVGAKPDQTKRGKQVGHAQYSLAAQLVDEGAEATDLFTSPYPNFTKVMKTSNISSRPGLKIPRTFSRVHFPMEKTELVLRNPAGDRWTVNFVPKGRGGDALSGGWPSFVRANNIQLRDICVFELVDGRELQVHIFRATQQGEMDLGRLGYACGV